jgi:nicotinamide riboside transporter PnuC
MVRKKLDTWVIWFVNDILYVIQYSQLEREAYYLIFLNLVWTIMAIASFINWSKIMKGDLK